MMLHISIAQTQKKKLDITLLCVSIFELLAITNNKTKTGTNTKSNAMAFAKSVG